MDGRIWILLSDDIPAIQDFWRAAQSVLDSNTYLLGNSVISTPAVFKDVGLPISFMNVILGGYIGLQHADQVLLSALIYLAHNYYNNNRSLSINSCARTLWPWPDVTSLFNYFHRHQDWKVTPAGMDFIKRFQNYNRTMKTSSTGKVTWCSKAVDDTGYYHPTPID